MLEHSLPMGIWHTADSWLGIKVEWEALENNSEKEIASKIMICSLLSTIISDEHYLNKRAGIWA